MSDDNRQAMPKSPTASDRTTGDGPATAPPSPGAVRALRQLARTAQEFERAVWADQVSPPGIPSRLPRPD